MRILFLLTQDLDSPSGLGRYFPLARELVQRGHQVSIAALHSDFAGLQEKQFLRDGVAVTYVAQMHVLKRGSRKLYFSPLQLVTRSLAGAWALTRLALRSPADIVHIGKPHPMNSVAGLAARLLRRRTVFLDCDDHEATSNRFGAGWQQRGVKLFENFTPRHVDHITTHTAFMQKFLVQLGVPGERITYLPNGVDIRRFAPPASEAVSELRRSLHLEGCRVVAYIGSLSLPAHAVYLLIEAFALAHAALPHSLLLVVGGGEEFDALQTETRRRGLSPAVRYTGRIAPEQVSAYYHLANVTVDPVYDEPAAQGRLPLKLFESWYAGAPFVTGDVGDRRQILGQPPAGVLVQPGDAQALADGILSVLNDAQLAADLRQRGFERVRQYTWGRLAADLEEVYRQVSAGRPAPRGGIPR